MTTFSLSLLVNACYDLSLPGDTHVGLRAILLIPSAVERMEIDSDSFPGASWFRSKLESSLKFRGGEGTEGGCHCAIKRFRRR